MKQFLVALAILAGMTGAVVHAAPAHAATDQRPCVSLREWHGLNLGDTLAEVERDWEVTGHGKAVPNGDGGFERRYRACGYSLEEATVYLATQVHTQGRVPVGNLHVIVGMRFLSDTATLSGHE